MPDTDDENSELLTGKVIGVIQRRIPDENWHDGDRVGVEKSRALDMYEDGAFEPVDEWKQKLGLGEYADESDVDDSAPKVPDEARRDELESLPWRSPNGAEESVRTIRDIVSDVADEVDDGPDGQTKDAYVDFLLEHYEVYREIEE